MTTDDRFDPRDLEIASANDDTPHGSNHSQGDDHANEATVDVGARAFIEHDDNDPSGVGRLMLAISREHHVGRLNSDDPRLIRSFAASSGRSANDNVIWVGDDGENGGVYARDASAVTLTNGDVAVAWIGADHIVHARVYSAASEDHFEFPSDQPLTLKATLADLGVASSLSQSLNSRLKLSALPEKGFVAAWTTELALATILFSKAFLPADPAFAEIWPGDAQKFSAHELPPIAVPSGHTSFELRARDSDVEVTFKSEDGDSRAMALEVKVSDAGNVQSFEAASWQPLESKVNWIASDQGPEVEVRGHTSGGRLHDADDAPIALHGAGDDFGDGQQTANNSVAEDSSSPVPITPNASGSNFDLDAAIARVQQKLAQAGVENIKITKGDQADTRAISIGDNVLTKNALITDNGLDSGPAAAKSGGTTELAWVEKGADGTKSLVVASVTHDGKIVGGNVRTIATADTQDATFSQLDIASASRHTRDGQGGENTSEASRDSSDSTGDINTSDTQAGDTEDTGAAIGPPAAATPEHESASGTTVAVVWVGNADCNGYGTVSTQLFHIEEPSCDGSSLGSITAIDSNGDAAGTRVDLNGTTLGDVLGRAPTAEGLNDGSLAVAWVERSEDGTKEDVCAVVIDPDSEGGVHQLDLAGDMPNGIVEGTSPELVAAPDGELIVSWLQAAFNGGYEAAAEIFRQISGTWLSNGNVIILTHFDEVPQEFRIAAVSLTHDCDSGLSLSFAWHDGDGNVQGASITLDQAVYNVPILDNETSNSGCDNSGSGNSEQSGDAQGLVALVTALQDAIQTENVDAVQVAVIDFSSDTISFSDQVVAACSENSGSGSSSNASAQDSSTQDNSNTNSGSNSSGPSQADLDLAIANLAPVVDESGYSPNSGQGSSNSGGSSGRSGGNGTGSGNNCNSNAAAEADNDNLVFFTGFGNDAPDFVAPDSTNDSVEPDAIVALFDDLQLANALNPLANDEVLTFDADNVVTIKNFNSNSGKGGGDYFDTA